MCLSSPRRSRCCSTMGSNLPRATLWSQFQCCVVFLLFVLLLMCDQDGTRLVRNLYKSTSGVILDSLRKARPKNFFVCIVNLLCSGPYKYLLLCLFFKSSFQRVVCYLKEHIQHLFLVSLCLLLWCFLKTSQPPFRKQRDTRDLLNVQIRSSLAIFEQKAISLLTRADTATSSGSLESIRFNTHGRECLDCLYFFGSSLRRALFCIVLQYKGNKRSNRTFVFYLPGLISIKAL